MLIKLGDTAFGRSYIPKAYSEDEAYQMGYDCGLNGSSECNSDFQIFTVKKNTSAWENGKKQAEADKANK